MAIGSLFSKLSAKEEEGKETFLALEINDDVVKAASWSVTNEKVEVLKLGSDEEWNTPEEFIHAADLSITQASEKIEPDPEKIIFGLPAEWIADDKIDSSKKTLLASLCEKLKLRPVGFVVSIEALITYLKLQQGTPPSAIFVRVGESEIIVTLVAIGKIIASEKVGKSDDLALDIKEGLARFKQTDTLPARIILFDGYTDFEEAKQQIISYDWQAKLPFLHFPKVESLERNFMTKAIAIAGGGEVAKSLGLQIKEETDKVIKTEEEKTTIPIKEKEEEESDSLEKYGFIKDKDIKEINTNRTSQPDQDFSEPNIENENQVSGENKRDYLGYFKKAYGLIAKFPLRGLLIAIPLLIIIIAVYMAWSRLLKADVTLFFASKQISQEAEISINTEISQADYEKQIIPGKEISVSIEAGKQAKTSGEKLTGDKAQGTVTIYNKTQDSKKFPAGTILVGNDNLRYVLSDDVTVASESSQPTADGEQIVWGKNSVKINAAAVGTDFNTDAGTTFSFKDFPSSSFAAKSDNGIKGGTSRKIQVVSLSDRDKLLADLTEELKNKGLEKLKNEAEKDIQFIDDTTEISITNKKYNKKVDDEAESLNLDLTATVKSIAYSENDLNNILTKLLEKSLPSGYSLIKDSFDKQSKTTDIKNSILKTTFSVNAKAIPVIDESKLKIELSGKSTEQAKEQLVKLPDFVKAQIDIYPSLLGNLKLLPRSTDNIKIEIQAE